MTEPTLTCPTCRTEIKLTESLAAPLIAAQRRNQVDNPENRNVPISDFVDNTHLAWLQTSTQRKRQASRMGDARLVPRT